MYKLIKTYIVKEWDELTDEEKEREKEKNMDSILESWQELLREQFEEEMARASNGAIKFSKDYYDSLGITEYCNSYCISIFIKNITANYEAFDLSDLYFKTSDGQKKLLRYNDTDKITDGGHISISPKYKISQELEGYVTFEEIEKACCYDEDFDKIYKQFIEDYNSFVDDINNALSILNDLYDIPDEFVEDSCQWKKYTFFEKSEVIK